MYFIKIKNTYTDKFRELANQLLCTPYTVVFSLKKLFNFLNNYRLTGSYAKPAQRGPPV